MQFLNQLIEWSIDGSINQLSKSLILGWSVSNVEWNNWLNGMLIDFMDQSID